MPDIELSKNPSGSFFEIFKAFMKLGLTSFGGPVAHLAYFRSELIEKQKWLSESQFTQLLAICQFLPGPASSQLGFSLGLLRGGWPGAMAAFLAFTLPSALLLIGFASLLSYFSGQLGIAIIHGLKLVACAVVANAVLGMTQKLCPDSQRRMIAILATSIALFLGGVMAQIIVVIFGSLAGVYFCRDATVQNTDSIQVHYGVRLGYVLFAIFFVLLVLFIFIPAGSQDFLIKIAQAFYQAGAVVFGGGHVVLPLLEEYLVTPGLVSAENFLAGYGAAQAIPGPMFAFSGYLGAMIPGEQISLAGASIALIFMFLPGFLLVSAALPMWQSISRYPIAARAIAGVNAAIVGLLAAALYDPIMTTGVTSMLDLVIVVTAFSLMRLFNLSTLYIVAWCVFLSIAISFV